VKNVVKYIAKNSEEHIATVKNIVKNIGRNMVKNIVKAAQNIVKNSVNYLGHSSCERIINSLYSNQFTDASQPTEVYGRSVKRNTTDCQVVALYKLMVFCWVCAPR
jgi:hypothetical protein